MAFAQAKYEFSNVIHKPFDWYLFNSLFNLFIMHLSDLDLMFLNTSIVILSVGSVSSMLTDSIRV